jgi:ferredoxin
MYDGRIDAATHVTHLALTPKAIDRRLGGRRPAFWKEAQVTYIVNESCIRCKYMDCVEVSPVDCFYEGENMLSSTRMNASIAAFASRNARSTQSKPDTEPGLEKWLDINRQYSEGHCHGNSDSSTVRRRLASSDETDIV